MTAGSPNHTRRLRLFVQPLPFPRVWCWECLYRLSLCWSRLCCWFSFCRSQWWISQSTRKWSQSIAAYLVSLFDALSKTLPLARLPEVQSSTCSMQKGRCWSLTACTQTACRCADVWLGCYDRSLQDQERWSWLCADNGSAYSLEICSCFWLTSIWGGRRCFWQLYRYGISYTDVCVYFDHVFHMIEGIHWYLERIWIVRSGHIIHVTHCL